MPETTPLIKAALNLRGGAGFDVYGITVFMPSMKDKEDEYRDVCFPIKPELRSQINTAVLNAYDASLKENEPDGE